MTIAISLKVNDGLVLAADSATTLIDQNPDTGEAGVVNVYNHANKVFNLVKGLPIGVITWGAGAIGSASISTLVKDLRKRLTDDATLDGKYEIEEVASIFREFIFEEQYVPAFKKWQGEKPSIGFIVAGYSSGATMAEEYSINILGGECPQPALVRPIEESGISWNGEPEAISRLLLGTGTALPIVLQAHLGVPADQVGPVIALIQQQLAFPLIQAAMPFRDAIDLAEFLVELTIKFSRFSPGAPTVGGAIEIAAISKHEHFKWVERKYYYTRDINPKESA